MTFLTTCLTDTGKTHRVVVMNPKAITDSQMYGIKDPVSEEWTPGVFASIWHKYNHRLLKYTTGFVCDGPVDATYEAINLATKANAKVDEYVIQAITRGSEAMGEVTVRVSNGELKTTGRGASTDIIEASARAYVDAINRLELRRGRGVALDSGV